MLNQVGIILAGGGSTRFSGEKAFALYNGQSFYQHLLTSLSPAVERCIIVSRPDLKERFITEHAQATIIEDVAEYAGRGPLAGIVSAMKHCPDKNYIVVAVDMPSVNEDAVKKLIQFQDPTFQATVPIVEERMQPLFALYRSDCLPVLEKQLKAGNYRMRDFIDQLNARYVSEQELGIETECFVNINDDNSFSKWIGDQSRRKGDNA